MPERAIELPILATWPDGDFIRRTIAYILAAYALFCGVRVI